MSGGILLELELFAQSLLCGMFLALLYDLCRKSGKTVIVVTHNGALAPTADLLMRMKSGKIESFTENPNPVPVEQLEW